MLVLVGRKGGNALLNVSDVISGEKLPLPLTFYYENFRPAEKLKVSKKHPS